MQIYKIIKRIKFYDISRLPEDEWDRSQHGGVMTNCVWKYDINIRALVGCIVGIVC